MERIKVGVVFGGRSGEHEVSLRSAASIIEILDLEKYEVIPLGITREGAWIARESAWKLLKEGRCSQKSARALWMTDPDNPGIFIIEKTNNQWILHEVVNLDVVFPVLHGPYGEDGTVQGLLELVDIPYVGSGVLASSLGMDKVVMKQIYQQENLPVGPYLFFNQNDWHKEKIKWEENIAKKLGYPCFVKPANLGSSVGISKVNKQEDLGPAIKEASRHDEKILVEALLQGREIECSVLGDEDPRASLPGEVIPGNDFYDYDAKYGDKASKLIMPADLSQAITEEVQELSIAAFKAIGATGLARVDFFVDTNHQKVIINEINTMPGFTSISMYPKLWEASGLSYRQLVEELIELAIQRHKRKRKPKQ